MNLKSLILPICLFINCDALQAGKTLVGKKAPNFTGQAVFPNGSIDTFNLKDYEDQNIVLEFCKNATEAAEKQIKEE